MIKQTYKILWYIVCIAIIISSIIFGYLYSINKINNNVIYFGFIFIILIILYLFSQFKQHGISIALNRKKELEKITNKYELDKKVLLEFNKSLKSAHNLINLIINKSKKFIYIYSGELKPEVFTDKIIKKINNFSDNNRVVIILEKHNINPVKLSENIITKEGYKLNSLNHCILSDYGMRVELQDEIDENKTTEGLAILNIRSAKAKIYNKYKKYKDKFEYAFKPD